MFSAPYNPLWEFRYQLNGLSVRMVFTSVIGHLMELDFDAAHRKWQSCPPAELFRAHVIKQVPGVSTHKPEIIDIAKPRTGDTDSIPSKVLGFDLHILILWIWLQNSLLGVRIAIESCCFALVQTLI